MRERCEYGEGREEPWLERWRADVARYRELGGAAWAGCSKARRCPPGRRW